MHKRLPSKESLRRIARHCRVASRINPYTCIQRALINFASDRCIKQPQICNQVCFPRPSPFPPPAFLRHADNTRDSCDRGDRCRRGMFTLPPIIRCSIDDRSLAVLAGCDTKHNPTIIAMFLSYVCVFCTCFDREGKERERKRKLSRELFSATKEKTRERERE